MYSILELPHAGGVPSGATVFNVDVDHGEDDGLTDLEMYDLQGRE